jgi:hypothetical protein
MRFAVARLRDGHLLGWVGTGGGAPLEAVPWIGGDGQVVTPRRLRWADVAAGRLLPRFELPAGERFLAPAVSARIADVAASDRALYLFPSGSLLATTPAPRPFAVVPLGGAAADLDRAVVAAVPDGFAVSFLFGYRSERDLGPARQVVLHVGHDGSLEVLADAPLVPGLPAWVRHRGSLVSPVMQALDDLVRSTIYGPAARRARPAELLAHPPPRRVFLVAALLALLAAAATWALARRRVAGAGSRSAWAVAALLLGPPVPLALLLFVRPPS